MLPSPHEPEFYASMTEEEIRDRLGVAGTNIAMEWEREDLLNTLMEIDKVIPEMSKLDLSIGSVQGENVQSVLKLC